MKKLKKLRLKSVPNIMTETEMKHVVGGYSTSGHCYDGQFLFTCITTFHPYDYAGESVTTSGSVCATDSSSAADAVRRNLQSQGVGGGFNVACY